MGKTRARLESYSTDELISLANTYGIDIPKDLERVFIIEELLECAKNEEREQARPAADNIEINSSYSETVLLPAQYNISYIDVIVRDPLWVYAFWEVKEQDKKIHENAPDFKGYALRIVPLDDGGAESAVKEDLYTINVNADDNDRYIGFAEHSALSARKFIIKLGAIRGESEFQIAFSKPFCLPRFITDGDIKNFKKNPLIGLSGIADLPIIINRS